MRSSKLVSAAAATATLLALAPAGATARPNGLPHKAGKGPCRVHLVAPPPSIAAGEAVTIKGTLTCAAKEVPSGRQVSLYQQAASKKGFVLVGTATTEATQDPTTAAFAVTPPIFEVNSVFFAISQGAESAHQAIKVAPVVTPTTPQTPADGAQLFTGGGRSTRKLNTVTFTGKVSPVAKGAEVVLQRENATANEEWFRISPPKPQDTVNENGEYSISHTFVVPGDASIRVVVHPHNGLNVGAASTPMSYEISQAENPQFTLESSADPLTWGASVELKGVVKGAALKTPVTLLAHTKGGTFAPVATGETGEGGAYKFSQAPLQNTYYKVTDATASSAVLFEGVKYALALSPPPSSIPASQPATFSGTVMPPVTGHKKVYLERQGSLKLGWSVIDIGELKAPAKLGEPDSFSIAHSFSTANTAPQHLRIKVPGDPSNQGIASAPFELTVTPTPASSIKPEAPGNSKLPSEGQL